MEFHHRKLLTEPGNSSICPSFCNLTESGSFSRVCQSFCDLTESGNFSGVFQSSSDITESGNLSRVCQSTCVSCLTLCPDICHCTKKSNNFYTFLAVGSSLIVATFLLVGLYVFYVKYYSTRRRSQPQQQPLSEETHDDYIDEDHGPVLDHPIWYINTIGLQQSIISSITVCQYKRGNGLVEGTECSVCLSEFQEDETLRLLPKCNHAFHVPCIDTWLRSHTNCPMCRATIVKTLATPAPEPNLAVNSIPEEETQVEISENIGESSEEMGEEICEIRIETEENREVIGKERDEIPIEEVNGLVEPRRSVSMDCLSASKISLELSNLPAVESDRNSNTKLVAVNKLNREIVPRKTGGNQLQRQKGSSSKGRSLQNVPLTMKRSSSCNGKVLFCRDVQNSDSVSQLRSF
ncbi:RING-H2 finger protein ATL54 [Prunus yedoensis var. nudiflora]|uniref:RING-type E3 ubiquitin transferase n=1 Tax=Prunus yedoensis var. nudiflora TaxID=2094558 RepID=A0A314XVZ6_PRUYE|nr:RING-H2 finger protein ATL54 [Prunus yedoensis var. nudiflora]